MATNKNARLRYEALDKCFSNFSRKFYIEDLQKAVCDYLKTQLSEYKTISRRQIYSDIEEMRTSPNMQAPIEAYWDGQRKYYRYDREGFSIVDLTDEELTELETTVNMLASFRGMPQFEWMLDIINKLKKKYKVKGIDKTIFSFDSNIDLQGIERFKQLFGYIVNEQPIKITYTPFHTPSFEAVIHPYFLKQYNNRWYLLGFYSEYEDISILPLDRIVGVEPVKRTFIPDSIIENPDDYFYDVIGVTIPKGRKPERVVLKFSEHRYPYIIAKPIHPTQQKDDKERIVTLTLIPNRELIATILGFGDDVEVVEPQSLRGEIAAVLAGCCKNYGLLKNDCTSTL
ncbi:putative DNA-binding transcriptional regulator YafY [Parabacteroides sp. PFB2-12]|uniref:helix-turn-helix transcriptional regulator n=1 Tax=unclassified Parabacteroides TaxID=2649774 RepID=UPI002475D7EF|nr:MULTISPECIES: WYL domain-containing protein [unclassified Parabacteroides]MDH6343574.1 putative DNA-binding transcriptional regulator YafY [Parabacteroides sp. PM6-13]MDH6391445.1 putative DNA-binding transcriptional regulator YafY [Parabacteroides sp. PFB2-12]